MRAEHEARSQGGSYSINRAANKTDKSHKVILSKGKSVKKRKRKNISNQNNKAQKKNKLRVLRPYKKIMPKVSSKKLGFKKKIWKSTIPNGICFNAMPKNLKPNTQKQCWRS